MDRVREVNDAGKRAVWERMKAQAKAAGHKPGAAAVRFKKVFHHYPEFP